VLQALGTKPNANGHHLTVGRDIKYFTAIAPPVRIAAAFVDFVASGFIGSVSEPMAIRRNRPSGETTPSILFAALYAVAAGLDLRVRLCYSRSSNFRRARAGTHSVLFHGSHLLAAGTELPAVSERLGHRSVYVTATVYSHRIKGAQGGRSFGAKVTQKASCATPRKGTRGT
jgi:hypothetical protein